MIVLGISGLENSIPFKKQQWPGLEEREYRISQGHDSAAALVVDGQVIAASAEERFNGKKHTGDFPIGAIKDCLRQANLNIDDVDALVHAFDYAPLKKFFAMDAITSKQFGEVFSRDSLLRCLSRDLAGFPTERVFQIAHHDAHAASAAFTSGWDECLTVVIDGMGESQSASAYHAKNGSLRLVEQVSASDSIGILYSLITLHIGFDFNADEYKIMGLAPYGDPSKYREFFEREVIYNDDGTFRIPLLQRNESRQDRETCRGSRDYLSKHLIAPRNPDAPITQDHQDVAAALQECLDRTMLHLCGKIGKQLSQRRLALAGGVALNCTANGKLLRSGLFDDIYVQPAAGDDGAALGAALHHAQSAGDPLGKSRMSVPFLGPGYGEDEIKRALDIFGDRIEYETFPTLQATASEAARHVADGKVLAWFRGRMEFGPRALGNRSIVADPGHPEMRDRINAMVKKREGFRPFAPAVSLEQVHHWFDVTEGTQLPYMIMIVDVREEHRMNLPAVTHVNGSARVQTVSTRDNPDFLQLLRAVGKTTGREMVLNTSFNVKGQPMVNTPVEAIETYLGTDIDYLFLENHLVRRSSE